MLNSVRILSTVIAIVAASEVSSQSVEAQAKALDLITTAADKICSIVAHAGNSQSVNVKGEVKAQLSGLIKQLVDLGISGAGEFNSDQYENVIRADLAATIRQNAECKLKVFDKLQDKMIK